MNEDRIYETLNTTPEGEGARTSDVADASVEASEPTDAGAMIAKNPTDTRQSSSRRGEKKEPVDMQLSPQKRPPAGARRSGSGGERKKEGADVGLSPQGGSGTQRASSDVSGMEQVSSDEMSMEQRKEFAAKRRRAEQRAAVDRAVSSALEQERERFRTERDETAFHERIDAELREIHRLDPSIRSAEDLLKMPAAREFYEYVRRGNTFIDAYYLANRERLTAAAAEAARQQTMNAHRSKDHLHPSGNSRGAGAASVPAEEMRMFKLLNPAATEAEIQAYYNRSR